MTGDFRQKFFSGYLQQAACGKIKGTSTAGRDNDGKKTVRDKSIPGRNGHAEEGQRQSVSFCPAVGSYEYPDGSVVECISVCVPAAV